MWHCHNVGGEVILANKYKMNKHIPPGEGIKRTKFKVSSEAVTVGKISQLH